MALSGVALVTGGAGFIGSHIAAALSESGARVRIIDNLSTGYRKNVDEAGADIDFIEASLGDDKALRRALEDVELVFHEAAIPSVPRSVERPVETHEASANATFSLLLAARDQKVRRVIYAASSSAYGDQAELPKREDLRPAPLAVRAQTMGEYIAGLYARVWPGNRSLGTQRVWATRSELSVLGVISFMSAWSKEATRHLRDGERRATLLCF